MVEKLDHVPRFDGNAVVREVGIAIRSAAPTRCQPDKAVAVAHGRDEIVEVRCVARECRQTEQRQAVARVLVGEREPVRAGEAV